MATAESITQSHKDKDDQFLIGIKVSQIGFLLIYLKEMRLHFVIIGMHKSNIEEAPACNVAN